MEEGRWRSEVGSQRSEVRGQRSEVSLPAGAITLTNLGGEGGKSEVRSPKSEVRHQPVRRSPFLRAQAEAINKLHKRGVGKGEMMERYEMPV